ncbi:MAG: DNA methyltransferase, partial [Deltaproteobacteria bacterium]|nr:DNA methyltransferase [Deltaproteobacteria bacterium]
HDQGGDALVANDLKKAAMERIFGFEILPAPFVIAHLQLGLELEKLGAPLSDRCDPPERAGVYLTNALTGWEPPKGKPVQIAFPGFDDERDAAAKVKQEKPILVILGNPPYNAFSGVSPEEEDGLVEPYKNGLNSEWGIKKFNLDDLYIRFFRLAEKRIAEYGGRGVVSFISNFSYLGDPSFVVMRRRFLDEFDAIWLDCMNGDSRETGKLTPEGKPDPSVFSTEWNREGIRVGTAIGLFVKVEPDRRAGRSSTSGPVLPHVFFRHFWGTSKRADLLSSIEVQDFEVQYEISNPQKANRWTFQPSDISTAFLAWPKLTELCAEPPSNGLMEKRGGALMDDDRLALEVRMKRYFDKGASFDELKSEGHPLIHDAAAHNAQKARENVIGKEGFIVNRLLRYAIRPFENLWCYYTGVSSVWNRPRPSYWAQCWEGNSFLLSRFNRSKDLEGVPFYFVHGLSDDHLLSPDAAAFSFRLKPNRTRRVDHVTFSELTLPGMETDDGEIIANLSSSARAYLATLNLPDPDIDQTTTELIWYHALAIGYSPSYLAENADGIRQDWPRIPLPKAKDLLLASAALGRQVAALLDTEKPVPGVTTGKIREELKLIAIFQRLDGKPAKPEAGDLDLTAGWGHAGKGGVTMPGKGKVVRRDDGAYDIFLNKVTCWRNVPETVWTYTIGGYQVIKKWLSYREKPLLGRGLTPDEVRYVTEMARRLSALIALQASLDANYRKVTQKTYSWMSNKNSNKDSNLTACS